MCESSLGRKLQHLRLLTKLGTMHQTSFRRLLPVEFDVALLKKLTDEGRVFIAPAQIYRNDAYKREVLDYVQAIAEFATEAWQKDIGALWQKIVEEPCFKDCLVMKKGITAGHANRYIVTNIVCIMQNWGVYRSDVSLLTLHLRLENATVRNKFYSSSSIYALNREARSLLKQLIKYGV